MRNIAEWRRLNEKERWFVEAYLDEGLRLPRYGLRTFCEEVWAYCFAWSYDISKVFDIKWSVYDRDSGAYVEVREPIAGGKIVVEVKDVVRYKKLKERSRACMGRCQSAINAIRAEKYREGNDTVVNELKDAIFQSAIHGEDAKDRNENRKMAMKITGLDQIKIDTTVDLYEVSGKQVLQALRKGGDGIDVPLGADEYLESDDEDDGEER